MLSFSDFISEMTEEEFLNKVQKEEEAFRYGLQGQTEEEKEIWVKNWRQSRLNQMGINVPAYNFNRPS